MPHIKCDQCGFKIRPGMAETLLRNIYKASHLKSYFLYKSRARNGSDLAGKYKRPSWPISGSHLQNNFSIKKSQARHGSDFARKWSQAGFWSLGQLSTSLGLCHWQQVIWREKKSSEMEIAPRYTHCLHCVSLATRNFKKYLWQLTFLLKLAKDSKTFFPSHSLV